MLTPQEEFALAKAECPRDVFIIADANGALEGKLKEAVLAHERTCDRCQWVRAQTGKDAKDVLTLKELETRTNADYQI